MGLFDGFKKKPDPAELETKLSMAEVKLSKREDALKGQRDKIRAEAKEALKRGDDRGFKVSSRKFGGIQAQLNTVGGMIEMAATMRDAIQQQRDLSEIVAIGDNLIIAQKALGFDTQKIEQAVTGIRQAVQKVTSASVMLATQTEMLTAASPEATKEQESLKAELMKEMELEKGEAVELEEKIKKAEHA